jgi:hypothetical protein
MLFKASVFLAVPAALTPVIASALLPRDCSGRTPYIILSVHEWLKIDVLDKDPAIPSQQWGQYGVFTKSFNFSVEDKYYTEHFIATSFLEQGEWDAVPHEALVAGQQYDVSDTRMPLGSTVELIDSAASPPKRAWTRSTAANSSISIMMVRSRTRRKETAREERSGLTAPRSDPGTGVCPSTPLVP